MRGQGGWGQVSLDTRPAQGGDVVNIKANRTKEMCSCWPYVQLPLCALHVNVSHLCLVCTIACVCLSCLVLYSLHVHAFELPLLLVHVVLPLCPVHAQCVAGPSGTFPVCTYN